MTEKLSKQFICGNCGTIFESLQNLTTHAIICFEEETTTDDRFNEETTSAGEALTLYSNIAVDSTTPTFQFFVPPHSSIDDEFADHEIRIENLHASEQMEFENSSGDVYFTNGHNFDKKRSSNLGKERLNTSKKQSKFVNFKPESVENFPVGVKKPFNYKVKCPQCQAILWRSNFTNHYKIHLDVKTAHCPICQKSFRTNDSLKMHTMNRHSSDDAKRFSCDLCNYKAVRRNEMKKHTLRVHKNRPSSADISNLKMVRMDEICDEIRRRANSSQFNLSCDGNEEDEQLKEFFVFLERRRSDIERKSKTKQIHASSFIPLRTTPNALSVQKLTEHGKIISLTKKIECDVCFKIMWRKNYSVHRRSHSKVYPYECRLCPTTKKFRYPSAFNLHMKWHRDENSFVCRQGDCNFSCFYKYQLIKHHETCSAAVDTSKNDVDVLTKKKYFGKIHDAKSVSVRCDVCQKQFRSEKLLQTHILVVHMNESCFQCKICQDFSTSSRKEYARHLTTSHDDWKIREENGNFQKTRICDRCNVYVFHKNWIQHRKINCRFKNEKIARSERKEDRKFVRDDHFRKKNVSMEKPCREILSNDLDHCYDDCRTKNQRSQVDNNSTTNEAVSLLSPVHRNFTLSDDSQTFFTSDSNEQRPLYECLRCRKRFLIIDDVAAHEFACKT